MKNSFWSRNGSTILTCIGAVGTIATAVLTAKATPKAIRLLEEAEYDKGEELNKVEVVKTVAPAYIPAVAVGTSTLVCIFGANALSKHQQASIASAYALLSTSYRRYKGKVNELFGIDANEKVIDELAKDDYDDYYEDEEIPEGEQLFYDQNAHQYFSATIDQVLHKTVMDDGLECYILSSPYDVGWRRW